MYRTILLAVIVLTAIPYSLAELDMPYNYALPRRHAGAYPEADANAAAELEDYSDIRSSFLRRKLLDTSDELFGFLYTRDGFEVAKAQNIHNKIPKIPGSPGGDNPRAMSLEAKQQAEAEPCKRKSVWKKLRLIN